MGFEPKTLRSLITELLRTPSQKIFWADFMLRDTT